MREKSPCVAFGRRLRPWRCLCARFSVVVLFAGTAECLEADHPHGRSTTMAARIDAPRLPSIRLASFAPRRELGDGRQTLGDASTQRHAPLLGETSRWSRPPARQVGLNRTAGFPPLPTQVSAPPARNPWAEGAPFAVGAVAINPSGGRGHHVETAIPESLAANFQVRLGTTRSVGLLRADDLVRTGGAKSVGIEPPASNGVHRLGLLSNLSSLSSGSTTAGSQSSWSASALGVGPP